MSEIEELEKMRTATLDGLERLGKMLIDWAQNRRIQTVVGKHVQFIEEDASVANLNKVRLLKAHDGLETDMNKSLTEVGNLIAKQISLAKQLY